MTSVRNRRAAVRDRRSSGASASPGATLAAMTVVDGVLVALSAAVFIYLGIAMFKPEWF
jgi:F subunit of K+-transporting ATPase (Potass_KdpF)